MIKIKSPTQKSTQTQIKSRVFDTEQDFRVELWSDGEIRELATEMQWNFNQDKGNLE
jgi:hypothetical protein